MGRRRKDFIYIDEGIKPGYYIECRYNYRDKNGELAWTNWFLDPIGEYISEVEDEEKFKEALKRYKESTTNIDKLTKRKHEYRIKQITEENDPCKELVELTKKYREIDRKKNKTKK